MLVKECYVIEILDCLLCIFSFHLCDEQNFEPRRSHYKIF
jgi:hypothetical protein